MAARERVSRSVIDGVVSGGQGCWVKGAQGTRRSGGAREKYSRSGNRGAGEPYRRSGADAREDPSGGQARQRGAIIGDGRIDDATAAGWVVKR